MKTPVWVCVRPSPPPAPGDFKRLLCCFTKLLSWRMSSSIQPCMPKNTIQLNITELMIHFPNNTQARRDQNYAHEQSSERGKKKEKKSKLVHTHIKLTLFSTMSRLHARYAGELRLKEDRKGSGRGWNIAPPPQGFNLVASSSAAQPLDQVCANNRNSWCHLCSGGRKSQLCDLWLSERAYKEHGFQN